MLQVNKRVSDLVVTIMKDVVPYYIRDRKRKNDGRISSKAAAAAKRRAKEINLLVNTGRVSIQDPLTGYASIVSLSEDKVYSAVVGELSCECPQSTRHQDFCKHLEAASHFCPLTIAVRKVRFSSCCGVSP